MRTGLGFDVHPFIADRPLVLGGVTVPHTHGLAGHSDADVLTHAVIDALLGSAALGDIGQHFPDGDEQWRGASSLKMLEHVCHLLSKKQLQVEHVDSVIVAQQPKLA
ncbi:MAG: 2-C-methyl-D-erythritol 2,4-cyclodiphosphate synthase, partial [Candidatus Xenobia bacterium]